jgi:2-iminobutanoate/2-iminopropanoate deaminase
VPKRFLNPGPKPPGYTHVVTSTPGQMVFISGQGGTDAKGEMPKDFATQCENTFAHLTRCLALGGAAWKDVVKINYYLKDIANLTELRAIRAKYLNMDAPPAATAVQTGLSGGMLIEIECTAIVAEG